MARILILLRHAKAARAKPSADDFDRPLDRRGREQAEQIGQALGLAGLVPDLVLCSPAKRAVETWERAATALPHPVLDRVDPKLYLGDPGQLLDAVRAVPKTATTLMVVGHNPAIQELAAALAGAGEPAALARMAGRFPVGAFAVIAFDRADWRGTALGAGRLERFVAPEEAR